MIRRVHIISSSSEALNSKYFNLLNFIHFESSQLRKMSAESPERVLENIENTGKLNFIRCREFFPHFSREFDITR